MSGRFGKRARPAPVVRRTKQEAWWELRSYLARRLPHGEFVAWLERSKETVRLWLDDSKSSPMGAFDTQLSPELVLLLGQLMQGICPDEDNRAIEEFVRPMVEAQLSKGQQTSVTLGPITPDQEHLFALASKEQIRNEIRAAYNKAGNRPPNIKQIPKVVQPRLRNRGLDASENQIAGIAGEKEFKTRRRLPGKTIKSERR